MAIAERGQEVDQTFFKNRLSRRDFLIKAGLLTVAGGAAVTGIKLYEDPSLLNRLLVALGLESEILPYFDNKASKGIISGSNIQVITPEEQGTLNLQPVEEEHELSFVFPIEIPEGTKIQYARDLTKFTGTKRVREEAEQNDIKDKIRFILPKGSKISAPFRGNIMVASRHKEALGDPNDSAWARLFSYDPSKDQTYVLTFAALDDSSGQNHFFSYLDAQVNKPDSWSGTSWEKLPVTEQGELLLRSIKENQLAELTVHIYKGKQIVPPTTDNDQQMSLATPNFITRKGVDNQEKLLVLVNEK